MQLSYKNETQFYKDRIDKIIEIEKNEIWEDEKKLNNSFDKSASIQRAKIFSKDRDSVIQALVQLKEFSQKFFFEDFFVDDCMQLLSLAENDDAEIAKLTQEVLPYLLKQDYIAHKFIEAGFFGEIYNFFPDTWVLECLTSIVSISHSFRDEVFNFGFYGMLEKDLSHEYPIADLTASIKMVSRLVKHENVPFIEMFNTVKNIILRIYYFMSLGVIPEFFFLSRCLVIDHYFIQRNNPYTNKIDFIGYLTIFSLVSKSESDLPILPIIEKILESPFLSQNMIEEIAKYFLQYLISSSTDKSVINKSLPSLIKILKGTYYAKASEIAASAILQLVMIDASSFILDNYFKEITSNFCSQNYQLKIKLSTIIAATFIKATNDQMFYLFNQHSEFDIFFDAITSLNFHQEYLYLIIEGIIHFVEFCTLSDEGDLIFQKNIMNNDDLENWIAQISQSDIISEDIRYKSDFLIELINKCIRNLKNSF